ncbi:hypothetical protein Vadar_025791 [Vaccinium darrowii]|uniref:Uncharacterized protein n=1 Tax=Vaccinium darrowii TaxID=229202 RepID=A0ACB7Y2H8_9ERIC|nr:hypothetical protein Vadar_025791 [Vaccinium darrowii]
MDSLDSDLLSLHELDSISHYLGFGPPIAFHFVVPGLSLDIGLVHVKGDDDVRAMIAPLTSTKIAELYIEHKGGVNVLERETDGGEFNTDELLVDVDVGCGEGSNLDEDDDSTNDERYSDSSYDMTDDDMLYETFVEDDAQFMGLGNSSKKTTNTVEEGPVENEEIILSDDYYDTEDENPYISSDDDNTKVKEHPLKKFRCEVHMEDPPFEMGMKFASTTVFKDAIKQHAIKHRRNVKFVKNDKLRVRA